MAEADVLAPIVRQMEDRRLANLRRADFRTIPDFYEAGAPIAGLKRFGDSFVLWNRGGTGQLLPPIAISAGIVHVTESLVAAGASRVNGNHRYFSEQFYQQILSEDFKKEYFKVISKLLKAKSFKDIKPKDFKDLFSALFIETKKQKHSRYNAFDVEALKIALFPTILQIFINTIKEDIRDQLSPLETRDSDLSKKIQKELREITGQIEKQIIIQNSLEAKIRERGGVVLEAMKAFDELKDIERALEEAHAGGQDAAPLISELESNKARARTKLETAENALRTSSPQDMADLEQYKHAKNSVKELESSKIIRKNSLIEEALSRYTPPNRKKPKQHPPAYMESVFIESGKFMGEVLKVLGDALKPERVDKFFPIGDGGEDFLREQKLQAFQLLFNGWFVNEKAILLPEAFLIPFLAFAEVYFELTKEQLLVENRLQGAPVAVRFATYGNFESLDEVINSLQATSTISAESKKLKLFFGLNADVRDTNLIKVQGRWYVEHTTSAGLKKRKALDTRDKIREVQFNTSDSWSVNGDSTRAQPNLIGEILKATGEHNKQEALSLVEEAMALLNELRKKTDPASRELYEKYCLSLAFYYDRNTTILDKLKEFLRTNGVYVKYESLINDIEKTVTSELGVVTTTTVPSADAAVASSSGVPILSVPTEADFTTPTPPAPGLAAPKAESPIPTTPQPDPAEGSADPVTPLHQFSFFGDGSYNDEDREYTCEIHSNNIVRLTGGSIATGFVLEMAIDPGKTPAPEQEQFIIDSLPTIYGNLRELIVNGTFVLKANGRAVPLAKGNGRLFDAAGDQFSQIDKLAIQRFGKSLGSRAQAAIIK